MNNNNRELLEQLFHLEWLIRRSQMHHHRERGPMGAPYQGQGRILALLKLKPEISQKELSTIIDIRSQSLGELLAKLENQGYMTRTPSTEDRRVMNISLTEAGKAAAEQGSEPENLESFFDCLSEAEQATLSDYLGRLIKRLRDQLSESRSDSNVRGRAEFAEHRFEHLYRRGGARFHDNFRGFSHFFDVDNSETPIKDQPEGDTQKE
jgi:DNA-binding MarR family transcriptional regulator